MQARSCRHSPMWSSSRRVVAEPGPSCPVLPLETGFHLGRPVRVSTPASRPFRFRPNWPRSRCRPCRRTASILSHHRLRPPVVGVQLAVQFVPGRHLVPARCPGRSTIGRAESPCLRAPAWVWRHPFGCRYANAAILRPQNNEPCAATVSHRFGRNEEDVRGLGLAPAW